MRQLLLAVSVLTGVATQAQIVIGGNVFGGARQADVGGSTFVHIGGEQTANDIIINAVYGGNDISGTIGASTDIPEAIKNEADNGITDTEGKNSKSYNAFIRVDKIKTAGAGETQKKLFIGQLFGGGYGAYDYGEGGAYAGLAMPVLGKTYMELRGGTFGYVYGGGDAVTVTEKVDISIDIDNNQAISELSADDLEKMNINTVYYDKNYHISRVFGGNNKAEMDIMPTWHLSRGKIDNLYSGGNEGAMTSEKGLLLEIKEGSAITVNNIYGGCRKADVRPKNGTVSNLDGYAFPAGLSARVIVRDGDITNVYGGNDVSGKVYGGAAVGVYHSIKGDIYGGGNGSYSYTDNLSLKDDLTYGDFYYDPSTASSSVLALNAFRPVTESASIFVKGKSDTDRTIIGGSIYCGGNSATLHSESSAAYSELKIGSYVTADQVFLGNNGVNLTSTAVLQQLAGNVTVDGTSYDFSQIDLKNGDGQMATYMEAVAMDIKPRVVFSDYVEYSTRIGSLYCGGNVGSMTYGGSNELNFSEKVTIFEKVVGGCNNANVTEGDYNAAYTGGITGTADATTGNKLVMKFNGLKIQPKRWRDASKTELVWNTKKWQTSDNAAAVMVNADDDTAPDDLRLAGGNVYGGCYASGYVNGNVVIKIKSELIDTAKVFGAGNSGVVLKNQYNDVLASALSVFGAGYGADSEIRGNTTINIDSINAYAFQTFGGGEMGRVTGDCTTNLLNGGKVEYIYGGGLEGNVAGSTYIHLGDGTCVGVIGGACNANIGGHTEMYIGDQGFPTITEDVYGGNDFGGEIAETGRTDLSEKVSEFAADKVYHANALKVSAYVEYRKGKIGGSIFGGNYGSYDYKPNIRSKKGHIKCKCLNMKS